MSLTLTNSTMSWFKTLKSNEILEINLAENSNRNIVNGLHNEIICMKNSGCLKLVVLIYYCYDSQFFTFLTLPKMGIFIVKVDTNWLHIYTQSSSNSWKWHSSHIFKSWLSENLSNLYILPFPLRALFKNCNLI